MSAPEDTPTLREFNGLRDSIDRLTVVIESLRAEMATTYVRKDVLGPQMIAQAEACEQRTENLQAQINDLVGWKTWALRLVVGFVVTALLGTVVVMSGARP